MIDLHNHILPGCDDGAKTIEESIEMLRSAEEQGITDVVNTIHFQHPKMEGKRTDYEYISTVKNNLQDKLININININIHLGAEVFFDFNLLDILDNKLVTFCNMKYMLVEFQPMQFPINFDKHLYMLALKGITPIIAHPERYRPIQEDLSIIERLINSGCIMQIDAGSLLGQFGRKCEETANEMLTRNMVHIIGSDSHNNRNRNFCLKPAFKIAKEIIGNSAYDLVKTNPENVIMGKKIETSEVIDNQESESKFTRIIKRFWSFN